MIKFKHNLDILLEDTVESYYWVGFLAADGFINHEDKRLKLQLNDRNQIEKFRQFIKYPHLSEHKYNSHINGKTYTGNAYLVQVKDTIVVPRIIKKFDFKPKKTYNPPTINIQNDNLFIGFLIGFIDGDGNIVKQSGNRRDCRIRIKCHKSWQTFLTNCLNRLYAIAQVNYYNCAVQKAPIAKINKQGYTQIEFANSQATSFLKKFIIKNNLPVLERKWNQVSAEPSNFYKNGSKNKEKILLLIKEGKTTSFISQQTGVAMSTVSTLRKEVS